MSLEDSIFKHFQTLLEDEKRKQYEAQVHDLIGGDVSLHDKQDLIQKFIEENN